MKKVVLVLGLVLVLVSCSSDDSIECDGKYVTYWEEVLNDNGNISYMADCIRFKILTINR